MRSSRSSQRSPARGVAELGERLAQSLRDAPVIDFGGYQYFVHPLTDGVPPIDPKLLREVAQDVLAIADVDVDKIVTVEAMGIPVATAVALATGLPLVIVRKRRYGLPGEREVGQQTGYSKGALYVNGLEPGERVLLIDDVVSTGGTLEPLLRDLQAAGIQVKDIVVIVEKGDGRAHVEKACGVQVKTLARIAVRGGRVHVL